MANRAKKTNEADKISNLPITLIHHILSFLPAHEMVQTCIFSKNWNNIWFSSPSLHIDNQKFQDYRSTHSISFEKFVDFLLLTRGGSNIHKFVLSIDPELKYDNSESEYEFEVEAQALATVDLSPRKVNAWILNALRRNVEIIDVKYYMSLTPLLFSCESLRELRLSLQKHHLDLPELAELVNLPSLRVLHLHEVFIQAGQLDDAFFSAMPCLETLNLESCKFSLEKLSIESAYKLTTLIMTGDFLIRFELSISAPNLKFLKLGPAGYYGSIKTIRFKNNCIQLINANIESGVSCFKSMIELFAVLWNTSSLKLSSSFVKVWSTYSVTPGESFEAEEEWSKFELSRLKMMEINNFQATKNQIRLVKFLLENALVLEEMIITTSRYGSRNKQEIKIVGKELLLYPRASPTLVMQFG